MQRLHIHVGVDDLDRGIRFYNALFGVEPVKTREDYAKWMLDDPRVNFAISTRTGTNGIDHLGIQAGNDSELETLRERVASADLATFDEGETTCCYARSDKTWVRDPAGVAWETFRTMEDAELFSADDRPRAQACCAPKTGDQAECC